MKDTFKKFGKDALNTEKNEVASEVETAKKEMTSQVIPTIENKKTSSGGFGSKLAKKATGAGDLLQFDNIENTTCIIQNLLLEDEKTIYYLESVEESIAITNRAIIHSEKASMTSSKSITNRYEFKDNEISHVQIETAGTMDRDAELKFRLNEKNLSWDINKSQLEYIIKLYMSLLNISKTQKRYARKVENLKLSLSTASNGIKVNSSENTIEDFITIVNYSEKRLNDMIVTDYSDDFTF